MVFLIAFLIALLVYALQFKQDYKEEDLGIVTISIVGFIFFIFIVQMITNMGG